MIDIDRYSEKMLDIKRAEAKYLPPTLEILITLSF